MALAIGIDLGGTKVEIVVIDESGAELIRRRRPTPRDDYEGTLGAIAGLIDEAERELGRRATVGISHPGAVSPATGLMKNANSTWLNARPLALSPRPPVVGMPIALIGGALRRRLIDGCTVLAVSERATGCHRGSRRQARVSTTAAAGSTAKAIRPAIPCTMPATVGGWSH